MGHLLYLMFRCDGDVMESLEILWELNTTIIEKVGEKVTSHTVAHCSTFRLFVVNIILPRPNEAKKDSSRNVH